MIKKNKERSFYSYVISCLSLIAFTLLFSGSLSLKVDARAPLIRPDKASSLIWFGDSRTVYFGREVYRYHIKRGRRHPQLFRKHIVAKSASTLSWARTTGYRELCKRLRKNPEATLIFNFGVNDIGRGYDHRSGYLSLIRKILRKYPKITFCYMTVNPVRPVSRSPYLNSLSGYTINRRIHSFNSYMRRHLPGSCIYINTNRRVHFSYVNDVHYTHATYRRICRYITGKKRLKK